MNRLVYAFATLLALSSLAAPDVLAQYRLSADVTFASEHYVERTGGTFNEVNPGLFLTARRSLGGWAGFGVGVGTYQNSFDNLSGTAAFRASVSPHEWVRFGVSVGAVSGYGVFQRSRAQGIIPLFTQSVRLGPPRAQLLLLHIGQAFGFGISFDRLLQ
jgi:hypothetical protein